MRHSLCVVGAVTAILLRAASSAAAQPRYAVGTYRYEMVTEMRQRQEVMGTANESAMRLLQRLTVTITERHRDTLGVSFVIDSVDLDVGQVIPDSLLPDLRGMTMTGTMSPLGRLYALRPSSDSLADLTDDFRTFSTALPREMAVGTSWVDTTVVDVNPAGLSLGKMTMMVTSRIVADTTYDGVRAWKLERTSAGTGGGTNTEAGTEMRFEMTARGSGTAYFGRNGVYLGGTGSSDSKATVSVPAHNITLPVTATGSSRVRLIHNP